MSTDKKKLIEQKKSSLNKKKSIEVDYETAIGCEVTCLSGLPCLSSKSSGL